MIKKKQEQIKSKGGFTSLSGFLLAAVGSAVGLGNILRFPSVTSDNGGGVFLIIYLCFVSLLGYPLLVSKLALGRAFKGTPYNAYKSYRGWRLIGSLPALIAWAMHSFYNIVIGWLLSYTWRLLSGSLFSQNNFEGLFERVKYNTIIHNLFFTALTFILVAWISRAGVSKGVERLSRYLMPIFVIIMLALICYSLSLKGAKKGLYFFLKPSWSGFKANYRTALLTALGHAFLSLSIGAGQMVTYGAYTDKKIPLARSAFLIVVGDTLVALLAGVFLFSFISSQGGSTEAQGDALAFIYLPKMFSQLGGLLGSIVGLLFFTLLIFAALTSSISQIEVPVRYLQERFGWEREKSVFASSASAFLLSIICILGNSGVIFNSIYLGKKYLFMEFLELIVVELGMPLVALLFSIFVIHTWGIKSLIKELKEGETNLGEGFSRYLQFALTFIVPLFIGLTLVVSLLNLVM